MRTGIIIKTDRGSWAFTEKEALYILESAKAHLMNEWKKKRETTEKPSALLLESIESIKEITSSIYSKD